jgi:hypothetical protein
VLAVVEVPVKEEEGGCVEEDQTMAFRDRDRNRTS